MPLASLVLLSSLWGCRAGDAPLPKDDPKDSGVTETDEADDADDTGDTDGTDDTDDTDDTSILVTYPGPEGVTASSYYAVSVEQDGTEQDSFVYEVNRQQETNASLTTSWTTFSFSGTVTVTVTKLSEGAIGTCEVLPSSFDIETEVSGNDCTFTLERPRKVSVELDGDTTRRARRSRE